jgi:hypothetical protein
MLGSRRRDFGLLLGNVLENIGKTAYKRLAAHTLMVSHLGYKTVATHVFDERSAHLESDE